MYELKNESADKSAMDFRQDYNASILGELPQPERVPHYYFPGAKPTGGPDGVLVSVEPLGDVPWIGTFAFGTVSPRGVTGIFATPRPDRLCVVARGRAFIVAAAQPTDVEELPCVPVLDVRLVPESEVIVFANHTELFAYGADGMKWRTKRLAWDSLKITGISNGAIKGEFWDIRSEQTLEFAVDLATGKHDGGADFS